MSIDIEDMPRVRENFDKVRKYVIDVLGRDALNSNHYGQTLLCNQVININTPKEIIVEIWNNYVKLYNEVRKIFSDNNYELKDEYFNEDIMSGRLSFLNIRIDVYAGLNEIKKAIFDLFKIKKRLESIMIKYNDLKDIDFKISYGKPYEYLLFGNIINSKTTNKEIESIISKYYFFNQRINSLLKISNYKSRNILFTTGDDDFFIFGEKINENKSDSVLLDIINRGQLFESRLKSVLKELGIVERHKIAYEDNITVWFRSSGSVFKLDTSYEDMKKEFINIDKWHNFRKKRKN